MTPIVRWILGALALSAPAFIALGVFAGNGGVAPSSAFLAALLIGLEGAKNFLTLYAQFNELLLYLMVPWTAVNLVDYYLVRFGNYHVPSFFTADGGIYGKYNPAALGCYALGIAVQIPFVATDLYTGPFARAIGGIDLSWIVGLVIVGPVYYFAARAWPALATVPESP